MGVCCGKKPKESYTDSELDAEREIRTWEESVGGMKKSFNFLYVKSRFNSNLSNQKLKDSFFETFFSKEVSLFLNNSQLFKSNNEFNSRKLIIFMYLFSKAEARTSLGNGYFDKSLFLIQEILNSEEENINSPIEGNDKRLHEFICVAIEITIEICKYYVKETRKTEYDYIREIISIDIDKACDYIIKSFINDVVSHDKDENKSRYCFNNSDLSGLFMNNKWLMTTGSIREMIFEYLQFSKFHK